MNYAILDSDKIIDYGSARKLWPTILFSDEGPDPEFLSEHSAVKIDSYPPHDPETQDLKACKPYILEGYVFDHEPVERPPVPPQPRWTAFGVAVMSHPGIKAAVNNAIAAGESPLALGLATGLSDAAKGDPKVFLGHDGTPGTWTMAMFSGLITTEVAAEIQAVGVQCNLPADFIAGLNPEQP